MLLMLRSIATVLNLKIGRQKTLLFKISSTFLQFQSRLREFVVFFFYRLCWQWQQRKTKHYSRGTASFADQRSPFTGAYGAILQSRDFNFAHWTCTQIFYPWSWYLKNGSGAPTFFNSKNYITAKEAERMCEIGVGFLQLGNLIFFWAKSSPRTIS